LHFGFAEKRVAREPIVPLNEIFEIGVDAAVAESCGRRTLIGFSPDASFLGVAVGALRNLALASFVRDSVIHAQRSKDAFAQEFAEGPAGDFRYHQPENHVT